MIRNPDWTGKKILHIHVPKCAGNSVFHGLREAMQTDRSCIPDAVGMYLTARRIRRCRDEYEFETLQAGVKQTCLLYFLHQGHDLLSGHLAWSPLVKQHFGEQYDAVTILREPLERFIAHVVYLIFAQPRTSVDDYYTGKVDPCDEVVRILNEPIGPWMARNITLYLGALNAKGEPDLDHAVDNAVRALDDFALVGFNHNLGAFADACGQHFGVRPDIGVRNTARDVHSDDDMRKRVLATFQGDVLRQAREMVQDDLIVYEAARQRFSDLF